MLNPRNIYQSRHQAQENWEEREEDMDLCGSAFVLRPWAGRKDSLFMSTMMVEYLANPNPKYTESYSWKVVPLPHIEKPYIEIHIWKNYKVSPLKHLSTIPGHQWIGVTEFETHNVLYIACLLLSHTSNFIHESQKKLLTHACTRTPVRAHECVLAHTHNKEGITIKRLIFITTQMTLLIRDQHLQREVQVSMKSPES